MVEGYNVKNRDAFASGLKRLLSVLNHYAGWCPRCTAVFATAPQQVPPPPPTLHLFHTALQRHRLHATSHPTAHAATLILISAHSNPHAPPPPQHFSSDDGTFALEAVMKPKARST